MSAAKPSHTLARLAVTCAMVAYAIPVLAQEPSPEALVDAINSVSGKFPNTRASGAKGVCVTGTFTPTADAAALSVAPHFASANPVLVRFSMGGGNPKISDKTKPVTRGFSIRFQYGKDNTDLVLISAPVFGTRTPAQLMAGIEARKPTADGKPDPAKVKAFIDANPETTRQSAWLNARPVPASWAGVDYWALHAFTLTNAKAETKIVKLKTIAAAGQLGLTEDEVKAKADSFYADELAERLARGPASFDLVATIGDASDVLDDITTQWKDEDARTPVKLGTIALTAMEANAKCDAFTYDPTNLPKGIAGPARDPMFEIRSPSYAISLSRRL